MFNKIAQGRVMNTEIFAFKKNEGDMDQITSTNVDTHLYLVRKEIQYFFF